MQRYRTVHLEQIEHPRVVETSVMHAHDDNSPYFSNGSAEWKRNQPNKPEI